MRLLYIRNTKHTHNMYKLLGGGTIIIVRKFGRRKLGEFAILWDYILTKKLFWLLEYWMKVLISRFQFGEALCILPKFPTSYYGINYL